ncbi:transcription elongation factor [Salegentibacter sp. HM20]
MDINKKELYFKCLEAVNKRIEKYQSEMDNIKESMEANDIKTDYDEDNKGQLLGEFEQYAGYLSDSREMKEKLQEIDQEHYSQKINFGSIVETDRNYYFISIPLGKIVMEDGSTVYAISTEAPIYQAMKGKDVGEKFTINGEEHEILNIH